jgi:hypothetical protein
MAVIDEILAGYEALRPGKDGRLQDLTAKGPRPAPR